MITKQHLQTTLVFDIETTGAYKTIEDLELNDPRLFELWKKRSAWIRKSSTEDSTLSDAELWIKKSALNPEFSRVVCVSMGAFDQNMDIRVNSFCSDDEKDILNKTNKVFENSRGKGWRLGGHTIKNFDIPVLGKRMLINGIEPSPLIQVWSKKPWETGFLDIAEIFSFGAWGHSYTSLDLMSCVLGVPSPKDEMNGSMVHDQFWTHKNFDGIQKYCEGDVIVTMECLLKMCF
jgi:predicted PolB exonuclease-like 3'-5' exonuclease